MNIITCYTHAHVSMYIYMYVYGAKCVSSLERGFKERGCAPSLLGAGFRGGGGVTAPPQPSVTPTQPPGTRWTKAAL